MELDHLVLVAPDLAEGLAHVRESLGLEMSPGGAHPEMGTHNRLLRLGDGAFLEVIAVDPDAPPPSRPRWFGLDDPGGVRAAWAEGRRLRAWVARTDSLPALLSRHGGLLGDAVAVSRGDRRWRFGLRPDGMPPEGGALPCPIDWGPRGGPAPSMPDAGARLLRLTVDHPRPAEIEARLAEFGLTSAPTVREGGTIGLEAVIETPSGPRILR